MISALEISINPTWSLPSENLETTEETDLLKIKYKTVKQVQCRRHIKIAMGKLPKELPLETQGKLWKRRDFDKTSPI